MSGAATGRLSRLAPAKVNLFLHVGSRQADGYHPLASLMVFADVGDRLTLTAAEADAYEAAGPFSRALPPATDDLVIKARDMFRKQTDGRPERLQLTLDKQLPLAAGLGGGSADAAAVLALLSQALGPGNVVPAPAIMAMAQALGSDVAACLAGTAVVAEGRGERLSGAPGMAPVDAVLVNPGAASSTARVFAALDRRGARTADRPTAPGRFQSTEDLARFLERTRNDLEAPAIALTPVIGEALAVLIAEPECLLGRMSGSGATVFGLCPTPAAAASLARKVQDAHPSWWVRACRLN